MRSLIYSNRLRRTMLLMPVRNRMIDKPLYMLALETALDASPISSVFPRRTLCARVLRVSNGYVWSSKSVSKPGSSEREVGASQLTQNHGTVLQIAPAIMGPPNGEESGPNSFAASCLTVS